MIGWLLVSTSVLGVTTRSEFIYSTCNLSFVPPLDNVCGLSQAQISAAEQSTCIGKPLRSLQSSAPPPLGQQQQQRDAAEAASSRRVFADCGGPSCDRETCLERQRALVGCLTYEDVATNGLRSRLTQEERSLGCTLAATADALERSTAAVWDAASRLNAGFGEYREAAAAAECASRAVAGQRDVCRKARESANVLRGRLSDAKTELAACSKVCGRYYGVYATECGPIEEPRRASGAASATSRPLQSDNARPPLPPSYE